MKPIFREFVLTRQAHRIVNIKNLFNMGKGDKKTKRGKIVKGTYGKRRQSAKKRKKKSAADTENAAE
ncbi:hypothetical protein GCM10011386_29600 [Parapedobacter defluvii]|uniref:30S ribosomal protein THX n=1 Tax=Parapedobacter defluvii TaxID=2045106 RepID=A0ABQ1M8K5_9SPHI|nr:hypothetical protein GCM10011386_29600 [Parapedobacter defluvii]